jgi:hypothetical protein
MTEIKILWKLGDEFDFALAWLQEHVGDIKRSVIATNTDERWAGFIWSGPEFWEENVLAYQELTGDLREFNSIELRYGDDWKIVKSCPDILRCYELFFVFDDEIDALTYKLTYSL